jgi:hypothetical protein
MDEFSRRLSACTDDVTDLMRVSRLLLNADKTELRWCTTPRRRHQLLLPSVRIGGDLIAPSTLCATLESTLDSDLSMQLQIQKTVATCFAVPRQLQNVRCSVPALAYQTPRLDYGNATLADLPAYQYSRL